MTRTRACDCPHGFPLCACREGLTGAALLLRSRQLSSLAGWPARLIEPPPWLATPPARPATSGGCGCGQGRA